MHGATLRRDLRKKLCKLDFPSWTFGFTRVLSFILWILVTGSSHVTDEFDGWSSVYRAKEKRKAQKKREKVYTWVLKSKTRHESALQALKKNSSTHTHERAHTCTLRTHTQTHTQQTQMASFVLFLVLWPKPQHWMIHTRHSQHDQLCVCVWDNSATSETHTLIWGVCGLQKWAWITVS